MPQSTQLGFTGSRTGLFSPDEVEQLMRVEFERAQRYHYPVACLVFSVDRLEPLHTVHGFESKTEILMRVVEMVRKATRAGDLLGYLVEDRLLCVFPHTTAKGARGLCERLLAEARELCFSTGDCSVRITLSIGLSHNENEGEIGFDTLRRVALEGLSVAEAAGGDRWAETELYGLCEAQHRRGTDEAPGEPGGGYRAELERLVAVDGDLEQAVSTLVERILERALGEARSESMESGGEAAPMGPDKQAEYQREIDLLRRRVKKLTESLGLTEQELARLRKMKNVEEGVASIYRDVQGLSPQDARAELKKQLMASIFEANLDLQHRRKTG